MLTSAKTEVTIRGHHSIVLHDELVKPFLEKGQSRVKAAACFEGKTVTFHAALKQWKGHWVLTFGKARQKELGVFPNDYFQLQLFEDQSKYGAEMPEELAAVLQADLQANRIFEDRTPGSKRSIIYAISRYARSQTRIEKSLLVCENLKKGVRKPQDLLKSPGY